MKIVVVGAGVAGLAAALALARDGHDIVLVDRDGPPDEGSWTASPWESRPGCAQLNQGHAFLCRGRNVLSEHAPDVYRSLVEAGANETDGNGLLPPEHHDPSLVALAVRRPLIDRALMRTIRDEPTIEFRTESVAGIEVAPARDGIPAVRGMRTKRGEVLAGDLVIDASGRRTVFPDLLRDEGIDIPEEEHDDCRILYYGRYYELHQEPDRPAMFTPLAARGTLGYLGFASFWQDGRIMAPTFSVPSGDHDLRALRNEAAFAAAAAAIKPMAPLVAESFATPVSPVLAMGGIENVYRSYVRDGKPVARGLLAIGDALCHTDPVLAWGMSIALVQAFLLPGILREADGDAAAVLHRAVDAELRDRFGAAARFSAERARHAAGRPRDLSTDREYLIELGAILLSGEDPAVLARLLRRAMALDPPSAIEQDDELMSAMRAAIEASGAHRKIRHPQREELLKTLADAV